MSVINKMLRDLEARRATPAAASGGVQATAPQRKNSRVLGMLLLGAAAVGATAFGDWPMLLGVKAHALPTPVQLEQADDPSAAANGALAALEAPTGALPGALAASDAAATPSPANSPANSAANSAATVAANKAPAAPAPDAAAPALAAAQTPKAAAAFSPSAVPSTATLATGNVRPVSLAPASAPAPASTLAQSTAAPSTAPSVEKRLAALTPTQRAQALYRQGLELAGTGHGRQAVERLQEATKLDPTLVAARIHTVSMLLEQSRGAEAETLAREGLALAADEPQLATLLARVLADRGDSAGALALLDRSERLGADGFGLRAGLLSQQGHFNRALQDYEQAVRLQPGNSLWWLGLGVALEAEGRGQQARQVYGRAQAIGMERSDLNNFIDQKLQQLD